jgi:hypothetical protein
MKNKIGSRHWMDLTGVLSTTWGLQDLLLLNEWTGLSRLFIRSMAVKIFIKAVSSKEFPESDLNFESM